MAQMNGPDLVLSVKQPADGGWALGVGGAPDPTAFANLYIRRGFTQSAATIVIPNPPVVLPDVALTDAYMVGILQGVRNKYLPCAGAKPGDRFILTPSDDLPAGYGVLTGHCKNAGFIRVYFIGPQLGVGVSNTFTLKPLAFR